MHIVFEQLHGVAVIFSLAATVAGSGVLSENAENELFELSGLCVRQRIEQGGSLLLELDGVGVGEWGGGITILGIGDGVCVGQIGFDVEYRRAIE